VIEALLAAIIESPEEDAPRLVSGSAAR